VTSADLRYRPFPKYATFPETATANDEPRPMGGVHLPSRVVFSAESASSGIVPRTRQAHNTSRTVRLLSGFTSIDMTGPLSCAMRREYA
jgi:hypothetical protein